MRKRLENQEARESSLYLLTRNGTLEENVTISDLFEIIKFPLTISFGEL